MGDKLFAMQLVFVIPENAGILSGFDLYWMGCEKETLVSISNFTEVVALLSLTDPNKVAVLVFVSTVLLACTIGVKLFNVADRRKLSIPHTSSFPASS